MQLVVRCDSVDGVVAAADQGADVIIFGGESYHHHPFGTKAWQAAVQAAHEQGAALWAGTPRIVREENRLVVQNELERAITAGVDGIYAGAMAVFAMIADLNITVPVRADWSLNIFNSQAARAYASLGCTAITASVEATLRQLKEMVRQSGCPIEAVVQGRAEMMVTESCVISSFAGKGQKKGCPGVCNRGAYALRDRRDETFPSSPTSIAATTSSTAGIWIWRRIIKTCAAPASPPSASKAAAARRSGSASRSAGTAASVTVRKRCS